MVIKLFICYFYFCSFFGAAFDQAAEKTKARTTQDYFDPTGLNFVLTILKILSSKPAFQLAFMLDLVNGITVRCWMKLNRSQQYLLTMSNNFYIG